MTSTDRRAKLSKQLHDILGSDNVYYDPPESIKMKYPAIVYTRSKIDTREADNLKYLTHDRYTVTFIRKSPDTDTVDKFFDLRYVDHDRTYKADNLYHDVFTVYI